MLGLTGVWLVGLALTGTTVLGQGRGLTPQERQQTLAQAALIVADRMYRGGQVERAMDHWREALSYDPNLVQAHYLLGLSLRDQGKPEEALTHLRTTTRLDPDNATAFADLGDTLHEQAIRTAPYGPMARLCGWRRVRRAAAELWPGRCCKKADENVPGRPVRRARLDHWREALSL